MRVQIFQKIHLELWDASVRRQIQIQGWIKETDTDNRVYERIDENSDTAPDDNNIID